jgi:hypothetical protein
LYNSIFTFLCPPQPTLSANHNPQELSWAKLSTAGARVIPLGDERLAAFRKAFFLHPGGKSSEREGRVQLFAFSDDD